MSEKILGIDLSFVEEIPGVEIIRGDIEDPEMLEQIMRIMSQIKSGLEE